MAARRRFCRDVALFAFAASCGVPACAQPDNAYQVEFPTSPGSPGRAASTIDDRIKAVVRFEACGDELVFYRRALESDVSEEILEKIIAKMMWASGGLGPNSPQLFPFECTSHVRIMGTDFKKASDYKPDDHPKLLDTDASDLMQNRGANLNAEMSAFYGGSCPNMITEVHTPSADEIEVTFRLTAGCMRSQVNTALKRMAVHGQPGSSGLPCNVVGSGTDGEWDVEVRDITRVFYLAPILRGNVLDPSTRDYVFQNLMTLDGPTSGDSYPLIGCGNQDSSTGSPEDRADEDTFANDAWDDLKSALKWIAIFVGIAVVAGLAAAVPLVGPILSGAVVAAGIIAATTRLPEPENHRLMIESSRYLANQYIHQTLADKHHPDADKYAGYLQDGKDWIIDRARRILREDFIEYNAKPYGRYSVNAILNLYDFAQDDDVRTAAEALLTYSTAKFAIGSNQGRRLPPWRRRLQGIDRPDITLMADYADHLVAFMMLQSGEVEHLPSGQVRAADGRKQDVAFVTRGAALEMVNGSSSRYRLGDVSPLVLELAIAKYEPFFQRVRHAGIEIYTGDRDYLITAGGVQTDYAYHGAIGFGLISTGGLLQDNSDRGSAPPTTFMATDGPKRHNWNDFLRFEGEYFKYDVKDKPTESHTFDRNTCVWQGFACGTNLVLPPDIDGCFTAPASGWRFLDSSTCPAFQPARTGTKFYLALYSHGCPGSDFGCRTNWGLLEAVDNPAATFTSFRTGTIAANPASDFNQSSMTGTYHSSSGHTIEFAAAPLELLGPTYGIVSVDGSAPGIFLGNWPRATGSYMDAREEAQVRIHKGTHWVNLDLRSKPAITFKYN